MNAPTNALSSYTTKNLPIHTGPGTPGGDLLRRYWQPIMLLEDFQACKDPIPLKILGEDLVLFRDDTGRIGLLGQRCAHRCADLSYGRVEDGGIRCVYHGWLFDVNGQCLEQPGEPEQGRHRDQVQQKAYPCLQRAGAIWAYFGPGDAPRFPDYPALRGPDSLRFVAKWHSKCNYLQANEGNIDPVHTSYLHALEVGDQSDDLRQSATQQVFNVDTAPKLSFEETHFGLRIFAERKLAEGKRLIRVTNFVMPNACAIGGSETPFGRGGASMFWHVPIDDVSHWRFEFVFHAREPLPAKALREAYSKEADASGIPWRNAENRYGQDRERLHESFVGMGKVFPVHDLFVTESQGEILDRTAEHLVTSDQAIVRARRLLANAVNDLAKGRAPLGSTRPDSDRSFDDLLVLTEVLDADTSLQDFLQDMQQACIYKLPNHQVTSGDPHDQ